MILLNYFVKIIYRSHLYRPPPSLARPPSPATTLPTVGVLLLRRVARTPVRRFASSHARLRFNPFPEHGATPPLWLRSRSECPDDKGLRHREECLPDGTRPVRGGL